MKYARVASHIFNTPLLIEPRRLQPITNYILARMKGEAPAAGDDRLAKLDERRGGAEMKSGPGGAVFDDYCGDLTERGIAVITITGELVQRTGGADAESGLLSYQTIERRLDAALADPRVRGILLEVDSPGGEAPGCFTLADKVFSARPVKPLWSLANEGACSAAYALACSTERVLLPESGHVGSIGVLWQALEQTALDKAAGLRFVVIQYGERKADFNPHLPIAKEALTWASAEVERLGEQFVALVARNRGLDPAAIRATQAGILFGPTAVEAGLADAIITAPGAGETLVTKAANLLADEIDRKLLGVGPQPPAARVDNQAQGAMQMSDEKTKAAAAQPGQAQPGSEQPDPKAAPPAAPDPKAQAGGGDAASERARIAAILALPEAKGKGELAMALAMETDMTPEAAAKVLAKATAQAGTPLAVAMGGIPEPDVRPDAPSAQGGNPNLMQTAMARRLGLAGK